LESPYAFWLTDTSLDSRWRFKDIEHNMDGGLYIKLGDAGHLGPPTAIQIHFLGWTKDGKSLSKIN
jgi:hypothetical protein